MEEVGDVQISADRPRMVGFDPLTGMPDRTRLLAVLERQVMFAADATVAVVFVDVDRLKVINDTFGHAAGDRAIRIVAGRLRRFSVDFDVIVRLGGDEFAACVGHIESIDALQDLCHRVLDAIAEPALLAGHDLRLSASIGIATNVTGHDALDLVEHADEAMYEAKRAGRNRVSVFRRRHGHGRSAVELSLRDLGSARGIESWFQPIVDRSGMVVAIEALARWRQGTEVLGPDEFIPLAERSGAMLMVTTEVLDQALSLARAVDDEITIHVNVSQTMLSDQRLATMVLASCRSANVAPARLCLEVTESAFTDDLELVTEQLEAIRSIGCRLAIDDFGTGYGALSLVQAVPVDCIKIDKSFVTGAGTHVASSAIVHSIVTLGNGLGAQVVAEGVDSQDTLDAMLDLGCDAIQGYLFGRPAQRDTVVDRLADDRRIRLRPRS